MARVRVVTLNNSLVKKLFKLGDILHILHFQGGQDKDYNKYADILEYSEEGEGKWTTVGEMSQARNSHGGAIVNFLDEKTKIVVLNYY